MSERGWLEVLDEVEASLAVLDEASDIDLDPPSGAADAGADHTTNGSSTAGSSTLGSSTDGASTPASTSTGAVNEPLDSDAVTMLAAAWQPPANLGPIPEDQFMRATRLLTKLRETLERAASKQLEISEELSQIDRRRQAGAAYLRGS